ncbi:bifunctional 3'-5' exonuclease/DNA polymerase [Naasia aerilata]|uniref:DNA-directed DNA polymerase n=1 Tax=Naasia aerilata TaxID=1162966 RepID=A0ABM8GEH1_9MICO|nr:bifunctional 3'-5' exonuclease/DNA polymerase [Naasia aerilata]BDZ46713.1 bifunctional 3'-5' exonuclease/DNA polymerase [Naasia aerilata]
MHVVIAPADRGVIATEVDDAGLPTAEPTALRDAEYARYVAQSAPTTRWVWEDTAVSYPPLLRAGVRVERCADLRLCRAILRHSTLSAGSPVATGPRDALDGESPLLGPASAQTLFDIGAEAEHIDPVLEHQRQLATVAAAPEPGRLRLLLAAESAGALAAAEMRFAGLPWSAARHEALLADLLGPRGPAGARPARLEELAREIRAALGAPTLNPDSPQEVLAALRAAGLVVNTTRSADLRRIEHPAIPPLLDYKKRSRILSANGWSWLDTWVVDGRFRADFLPGGVPSGRWAARGGGALQLPKQLRSAVVADPGWKLVVADAAQLEPRVLAALSGDLTMADAGRGRDLYEGIVATGAVPDRNSAKYAMLGAIYGATAGQGGRLLPRLGQAFPRAMGLVEAAARQGERGEAVTTRLGRSTAAAGAGWRDAQWSASSPDASAVDERRARAQARERGRFTRNFVVQGTAAEWALCWLAELRRRLAALPADGGRPELVYFLHDEVLVHTPEVLAGPVAQAVEEAAGAAGRLMFGTFPIDFPLEVAVVDDYGQA